MVNSEQYLGTKYSKGRQLEVRLSFFRLCRTGLVRSAPRPRSQAVGTTYWTAAARGVARPLPSTLLCSTSATRPTSVTWSQWMWVGQPPLPLQQVRLRQSTGRHKSCANTETKIETDDMQKNTQTCCVNKIIKTNQLIRPNKGRHLFLILTFFL